MDPASAYQRLLESAIADVTSTGKAWSSQGRKRKNDRDPAVDMEIKGEWLAAKDRLKLLQEQRAKGMALFADKNTTPEQIEAFLLFVNPPKNDVKADIQSERQENTRAGGVNPEEIERGDAETKTMTSSSGTANGSGIAGSYMNGFFFPDHFDMPPGDHSESPNAPAAPTSAAADRQTTVPAAPTSAAAERQTTTAAAKHQTTAAAADLQTTVAAAAPKAAPTANAAASKASTLPADLQTPTAAAAPRAAAVADPQGTVAAAPIAAATGGAQMAPQTTSAPQDTTPSDDLFSKMAKEFNPTKMPLQLTKLKEQKEKITLNRQTLIETIAHLESELCEPRQRTMDQIRSQLRHIDNGHGLLGSMNTYLSELGTAIQQSEHRSQERERTKPLIEKRKRLIKDREEKKQSLTNITPDLLVARQNEIEKLNKEIADLDIDINPNHGTNPKPKAKATKRARVKIPEQGEDIEYQSEEEDNRRVMEAWNNMDPEERKAYAAKVRASMEKFATTGNIKDFPCTHRKALRTIQCLLPEESFSSREMAIAIHLKSHTNYVCRYHNDHQKIKEYDGMQGGEFIVYGCGYYATYGKKENPVDPPAPGYMHCGCFIDDALMDFFFWKILSINSTRPDLAMFPETMKGSAFRPRFRAFVIKLFRSFTLLDVNDIFDPHRPFGKTERQVYLFKLSIQRMMEFIAQVESGASRMDIDN